MTQLRFMLYRLALVGILLVALVFRVWKLGEVPCGFHTDEAHYAIDAWRVWEGWRPVFMPGNNGREPLFMYFMAPLLGLIGPSIWTARLASVFVGLLVISATATFVRTLPVARSDQTALYTAALLAVTFWPVAQARYALRAHMLPLWVALLLWAWWHAVDHRQRVDRVAAVAPTGELVPPRAAPEASTSASFGVRWPWRVTSDSARWALLAGFFLAAAVYTHLTGRLLLIALVVPTAFASRRYRAWQPLLSLAIVVVAAVVFTLPLTNYFLHHPEMIRYRSDQVSAFNPDIYGSNLPRFLVKNGLELIKAFNISGDRSWYHNLSRLPVFNGVVGLCFLLGLVLFITDLSGRCGARAQVAALLVLNSLLVTLAPSWLSIGAPNYVRLTGSWPALFLLPARGFAWGAEAVDSRFRRWIDGRPWRCPVRECLAFGMIVLTAGLTIRDYFVRYASHPKVYQAFNGTAVAKGLAVASLMESGATYVSPTIWQQSVIRFTNIEHPPTSFDPRAGLVLPPEGNARLAFDPAESEAIATFAKQWPFSSYDVRDATGRELLQVFDIRLSLLPSLPHADHRTFGHAIALERWGINTETLRPGEPLTITLQWRAQAPTAVDQNLFVHLVNAAGRTVAQFDGPPLGGSYGTDRWRPGERILQLITVLLPVDVPAGPLTILLGWYDYRTLERLALPDDDDAALELGTVTVVSSR